MQTKSQAQARGPGRPRLGDVRIACKVPQRVADALRRREETTGVYRTRVAANVLCNWAKQQN
jgi:hypothetical protein